MRFAFWMALALSAISQPAKTNVQVPVSQEAKEPTSKDEVSRLQSRANAGDAAAQNALGRAYQSGDGVPQNDALAAAWFQRAADQGNADAENSLGVMYRMGQGVERDKEKAVFWYKKSAKRGNAKAMFNLGASYYNGDGVAVDDGLSYAWFLLAQQSGSKEADDALQRANGSSPQRVLVQRNSAIIKIARMYEAGDDLPNNPTEALRWYRKAADAGNLEAAVKVASLLMAHGREPTPDEYKEARRRCEEASARYSPAAYCMALIYRRGLGVQKDPAKTFKWLSQSALLGNGRAALELGEAYWRGDGVKPDLSAAYMWIFLALNSKVAGADQDEESLRKQMNAKQVEHAKQKAAEWSRQHYPPVLRSRTGDSSIATSQ